MDSQFIKEIKPKTIKFDDWMDIKKDSFGGPKSSVAANDNKNIPNWTRRVTRDKNNENGALNVNTDSFWLAADKDSGGIEDNVKSELSVKGEKYYRADGKAKSTLEDFMKERKKEN